MAAALHAARGALGGEPQQATGRGGPLRARVSALVLRWHHDGDEAVQAPQRDGALDDCLAMRTTARRWRPGSLSRCPSGSRSSEEGPDRRETTLGLVAGPPLREARLRDVTVRGGAVRPHVREVPRDLPVSYTHLTLPTICSV